jgi:hypothetical protein
VIQAGRGGATPGHECPGYASTKKPPEGGSIPPAAF